MQVLVRAARVVGKKMMCVSYVSGVTREVACKGIKRSALPSDQLDMFDSVIRDKQAKVEFQSFQVDVVSGCMKTVTKTRTIRNTVSEDGDRFSEAYTESDAVRIGPRSPDASTGMRTHGQRGYGYYQREKAPNGTSSKLASKRAPP